MHFLGGPSAGRNRERQSAEGQRMGLAFRPNSTAPRCVLTALPPCWGPKSSQDILAQMSHVLFKLSVYSTEFNIFSVLLHPILLPLQDFIFFLVVTGSFTNLGSPHQKTKSPPLLVLPHSQPVLDLWRPPDSNLPPMLTIPTFFLFFSELFCIVLGLTVSNQCFTHHPELPFIN